MSGIITLAAAPIQTQTYGPDASMTHPPHPHPQHNHNYTLPALEPVPALAEAETRETAEGGEGRAGKKILKSPLVDGFTCYIASIVQDMQDPQVFVGEQGAAQILKMQSYSDFVY